MTVFADSIGANYWSLLFRSQHLRTRSTVLIITTVLLLWSNTLHPDRDSDHDLVGAGWVFLLLRSFFLCLDKTGNPRNLSVFFLKTLTVPMYFAELSGQRRVRSQQTDIVCVLDGEDEWWCFWKIVKVLQCYLSCFIFPLVSLVRLLGCGHFPVCRVVKSFALNYLRVV